MSSTNKTVNYELTQFIGSDVPSWLVDYNGDMAKIDTGMHANAIEAASASSAASSAANAVSALANDVNTLSDSINHEGTGLADRVSDVEGDINTIQSLIGNGIPTTSDKTIIGAINELDSEISDLSRHALQGKKIAIVGDSLSTVGTWATSFQEKLDGIATVDIKSQGSKHMEWIHTAGPATILGSNDYDIIIIALGINDWRNNYTIGTFQQSPLNATDFDDAIVLAYKDILNYYAAGTMPEIWFITPFSTMVASPLNTLKYSADVYRKAIASFAKVTGCKFINGDCIPYISNALDDRAKTMFMNSDGLHFESAYNDILATYLLAKILAGGDSAVSGSDGVVMDLSSYLDTSVLEANPTLNAVVDGENTVLIGSFAISDSTALGNVINTIGTIPSDIAGLLEAANGTSNHLADAYCYGANKMAFGRLYLNGTSIQLAMEFPAGTTRGIVSSNSVYPSKATHMPHFEVS